MINVYFGDNLNVMANLPKESVDLIYIDPPFNTGKTQSKISTRVSGSDVGDRVGFKGKQYITVEMGSKSFVDIFSDYLEFLKPRLELAYQILKPNGSFFFHIDYREVHYCKLLLDLIFGRECFMNEIIWAYDYGCRSKRKWPVKHNNILWYAKNPENYTFRYEDIDRIPYMAPGLVTKEKAALGKTPTDTWWNTIVSPTGKEKTGYPTQKPMSIISRIIRVHSNPDDWVMDFFAGSGTTGDAAYQLGRNAILTDINMEAIEVMQNRFSQRNNISYVK